MHAMITLLAVFLTTAAAPAFKPGDSVVVVRSAILTTADGKTTSLTPGTSLVVQEVGGEMLTAAAGKVGRLDIASVISQGDAIDFFSVAIAKDPRDALALLARGKVWFQQGDLDKAIADLDESLRLAPDQSEAHTIFGWAWKRKGDKVKAMACFDRAIELNPKNELAWRVRGATWASLKDYDKALAHYNESLRLDPDNPDTLIHRSILRSVCYEDRIRNGKLAVADSTRACELTAWKSPLHLNALAIAYAEAGEFDVAINWEQKAIDLSPRSSSNSYQANLELYRQHRPVRMNWR